MSIGSKGDRPAISFEADKDDVIIGRAAIAHALGRSERTVTRWLKRGILPTMKAGPHDNNLLMVRRSDIARLATVEEPA